MKRDRVKKKAFRFASNRLPQSWTEYFAGLFSQRLRKKIDTELTDKLLEVLLRSLDLIFAIWGDFRKNIEGFQGRYVFATAPAVGSDRVVEESAIFENGDMRRDEHAIPDYDVKVTFADTAALRSYILSTDQDILKLMLENKVAVEGNVNYIYKFLFMVKDLFKRFGID